MAQAGQRKCVNCRVLFDPDRRNRKRQRYCSADECRLASKAASQSRWLADPANSEYHCGPIPAARVKAWREVHPGYRRGKRQGKVVLQDCLVTQVNESIEESSIRTPCSETPSEEVLQDLLNAPSPMLAGLIAHFFEVRLQDDMAVTMRFLVKLGLDILNPRPHEDRQASPETRTTAPGALAVQLG